MKKTYQEPQVEVIAMGTEQSVLNVSLMVIMATTPPETNTMNMSAGEEWEGWE